MTQKILALMTVLAIVFAVCPAAQADAGGLVPSADIVVPDFAKGNVKKAVYPQITPSIEFIQNVKAGWNLGNTFDAKDDGPGVPGRDYETYWCGAKTTPELIRAVKEAGFNLIRVPVSWHNHLTGDGLTIDPAWMARVKEVVGWILDEGMYAIINIHHDNEKDYLYPDSAHYGQSERYVTSVWQQVCEAFKDYDEHLIFEAMNEPRLVGSDYEWQPDPAIPEVADAMRCINRLNLKFVETVRSSGGRNDKRFLMIPGYSGSLGGVTADEFELPMDDRIIVEVHAYSPYNYALNMDSPDSSFDLKKDKEKKDEIAWIADTLFERFIRHGVGVIIDEFGALKKTDGDLQGRVNFTAYYAAAMSAKGIPCVWWDNGNFTGNGEKFGLINRKKIQWVYPEIALALLTNCTAGR